MSHSGVGAALRRTGFADLPSDCAFSLSDLRGLTRQNRVISTEGRNPCSGKISPTGRNDTPRGQASALHFPGPASPIFRRIALSAYPTYADSSRRAAYR